MVEIRKLAPGDRILDYRILEKLGEGGFGQVFRAEHEVLGRIVAIKVPRDQSALTALRHEGVVQASLQHPNIVQTLELSISHNPPYVVMEYVPGRSLAQLIKKHGAYPWRKAARVLLDVAEALSHAHSKGVIHGDVKPGNVLIERKKKKGSVMLTDFGLGRVFEGPQGNLQISRSLELATSGAEVQGTIRYLAPELLRGETADERADMYSFGVLLFETITGRLPEGREVPSDLVKDLPPAFDKIFVRMFKRKVHRPRSLETTIKDLQDLVSPPNAKAVPGVLKALPAEPIATSGAPSARRHDVPAGAAATLEELRSGPDFAAWRAGLVEHIGEQIAERAGVAICDSRGFDACYGVTTEGEPHHRIYTLVLPGLDATSARAAIAEARRVFDQEKGIWEKEVTFWLIAQDVQDHDQVLWTLKSFSMGWWRRRRVVLQDVKAGRLYATELGCDPRGNPLKRMFLSACEQAIQDAPEAPEPAALAVATPRRCRAVRGTAWGAALALVMTFGLLGSIMAVELANQKVRKKARDKAVPSSTHQGGEAGAAPGLTPLPARAPEAFEPQEPREQPKYY